MQDNINRKKIAPVVIAVLVVLYVGPLAGIALAGVIGLVKAGVNELLPFLLLYAFLGGAVVAGVLAAMAQRLKEIDGGEEEDAKKY